MIRANPEVKQTWVSIFHSAILWFDAYNITDTQFAFGIAFPIPATFFTTGGSPPFIPDIGTPTDSNEPYLDVRVLNCPSTVSTYCLLVA